MSWIILSLIVIISILLVLVVLIQNPKGGGISSGFQAANQLMGVKQSTDMVEKITWYLAIGLLVLCLFGGPMLTRSTGSPEDSEIETIAPIGSTPTSTPAPSLTPPPGE